MVNPQNSSSWDPSRFFKTLAYFGAIPILSSVDWIQQWLGSRPNPKLDQRAIAPNPSSTHPSSSQTILVIGAANRLGQRVLKRLSGPDYRVLTDLEPPALSDIEAIQAVIGCIEQDVPTLPDFIQAVTPLLRRAHELPIFDFSHTNLDLQEIWGAVDDVVMGGVSASGIRRDDSTALFSGQVSTANSGGFASIRTRNFEQPLDLSQYDQIRLRVQGDGKRYKFMLRSETRWDGVAYCHSFDTVAGSWIDIHIPMSELIPVFRAKTVPSEGSIDASQIHAFQLMLSKFEYDSGLNPTFEPGAFALRVASIQAYRQPKQPQIVWINASDAPSSGQAAETIRASGVPYTLIYPCALTDTSGETSLRVAQTGVLTGQVSREAIADLCIQALNHPAARNLSFSIAEGSSPCSSGDWACLFSKLQPDQL